MARRWRRIRSHITLVVHVIASLRRNDRAVGRYGSWLSGVCLLLNSSLSEHASFPHRPITLRHRRRFQSHRDPNSASSSPSPPLLVTFVALPRRNDAFRWLLHVLPKRTSHVHLIGRKAAQLVTSHVAFVAGMGFDQFAFSCHSFRCSYVSIWIVPHILY